MKEVSINEALASIEVQGGTGEIFESIYVSTSRRGQGNVSKLYFQKEKPSNSSKKKPDFSKKEENSKKKVNIKANRLLRVFDVNAQSVKTLKIDFLFYLNVGGEWLKINHG